MDKEQLKEIIRLQHKNIKFIIQMDQSVSLAIVSMLLLLGAVTIPYTAQSRATIKTLSDELIQNGYSEQKITELKKNVNVRGKRIVGGIFFGLSGACIFKALHNAIKMARERE